MSKRQKYKSTTKQQQFMRYYENKADNMTVAERMEFSILQDQIAKNGKEISVREGRKPQSLGPIATAEILIKLASFLNEPGKVK